MPSSPFAAEQGPAAREGFADTPAFVISCVILAMGPYLPAAVATTETAKLTAADGAASDECGTSVAISGDTMVTGAYGDDGARGSAYVFVRSGGSWDTTGQAHRLGRRRWR